MFDFLRKKKQKPIDLSVLDRFKDTHAGPDLSNMGQHGPSVALPHLPPIRLARIDPLAYWQRLDEEQAWKLLTQQRMAQLFPWCEERNSPFSEFQLYWELIRRSSPRFRKEIFVGLRPRTETEPPAPLFVPRSTFESHAYILGESNRGKTSQAVATLLFQLAHAESDSSRRPAILIFDLKPQGDPFLHAFAEFLAQDRHQELRFFSNFAAYKSLQFDPWSTIAAEPDPKARAGIIYKALSLIHPESQEAVFFMNEQRFTLEEAITLESSKLPPLTSLRSLGARLKKMTRGKGGDKEARGIHGALSAIIGEANVICDEPPTDRTNTIDFDKLFEDGEILYVHLESDDKDPSSKAVGKFMFACLLAAAKRRRRMQRRRDERVFVSIDEFQRLAAQNIVSYLETARDAGVSVILSHQSPESLMSGSVDLFSLIFDNTSFQQYLSLTNNRVIERLELVSGRVSEFLSNSTQGTTRTHGMTEGRSTQDQISESEKYDLFGWTVDRQGTAHTEGRSTSTSTSIAEHQSKGQQEVKIRGLTPETIVSVNNAANLSLVFVRGRDASTLSPLRGLPTLVERIFPFTWNQAEGFRDKPWPYRPYEPPKPTDELPKGNAASGRVRREEPEQSNSQEMIGDLFKAADPAPPPSGTKKRQRPKKTKGPEEPSV